MTLYRKLRWTRSTSTKIEKMILTQRMNTQKRRVQNLMNSLSNQPSMLAPTSLISSHLKNWSSKSSRATYLLNSRSKIHAKTARSLSLCTLRPSRWTWKLPLIADSSPELSSKLWRSTGRLARNQTKKCSRTPCSSSKLCLYPQTWT